MASQVTDRQSARTFALQRRRFALMAAESTRQLGENIRTAREALGLTQDQVARAMEGHVSGDRVSKWERGENRPRDETLDDLARVLQTTTAALLMREGDKAVTPDLASPRGAGGELAEILEKINARLDDQDDVLREIKAEQAALRQLIAEQRSLNDGTEELRRLAREIVTGRPTSAPNPEPAPERQ
jgi:transcriptional regulator with XRE-family HTH domain